MSAVEKLKSKLKRHTALQRLELARVMVPAHVKRVNGETVHVDAYTYERGATRKGHTTKTDVKSVGAMSDTEYQRHVNFVTDTLTAALKKGMSTDKDPKYISGVEVDANGNETPIYKMERWQQQKKIIDRLYEERFSHVPSEGRALITGGLGGSGKSSVLKQLDGYESDEFGTVNPDDIKEIMAAEGMVPELTGLSPMEASVLIHEEASMMAKQLEARARTERKNLIWDITMSPSDRPPPEASTDKRIRQLRNSGYTEVNGIFVDIPVDVSVSRALRRHRRGEDKRRAGEPNALGGRFVPPHIIRKGAHATKSSKNRDVFDRLRGKFDHWEIWDNSVDGRNAVKVLEGP